MARRQVQQAGGLVPRMEWRVRPDSEAGVLTQASRSRLEGNARLIGNGGSATYSFRILGGMDIALRLTELSLAVSPTPRLAALWSFPVSLVPQPTPA
jgi:hypothetical protein